MTAIPDTSNSESTQKKLDDAVQLLQLAASLHAARGDSDAWRAALGACRDWFQCDGLLGLLADGNDFGSDELDALAGRVTHCANFGCGTCAELQADVVKRSRCAALAPHLHEAAILSRKALQASVFDYFLRPGFWQELAKCVKPMPRQKP